MQRNIRNEIYIALGALFLVSFALVFAIFLSGSLQETPTQVASGSETTSPEAVANDTTIVAVTESPTITIIRLGTEAVTVEPSDTELVPSETDTVTIAPSVANTEAIIPSNTASATEIGVTLTPIQLDTALAETSTANPSVTNTSVPVSPTAIEVDTGIIPTLPATPTVESPQAASRTPASCQRPAGWTTYTVQAGNTLFAIALATRSTVDELRYVNCIANIDNIIVGQVLFVPRKPVQPVKIIEPSPRHGHLYVIGCKNEQTHISNLQVGETMNSTFNVYGSAARNDFWYYKIEVRPDWASVYNFFSRSEKPVTNGVLTTINPAVFGQGVFWIRLSVVNRAANIEPDAVCEIPVIFG